VGDCAAAQAKELVRALRHQLHIMTTQLAQVERQYVAGSKGRALRMEAAELRRDIKEAKALIDQLQRRYLKQR
jgi:predicted RNA-binding protein with PIN domain